jgi:predicted nucleic acid-binding protein
MVLIDTSAWIEAIRTKGDVSLKQKVLLALENGEARITEPVLVELFHGATNGKEIIFLREIQDSVPLLSCTSLVYEKAIEVAQGSRKKGITISSMDLLIYSVSKIYKTKLLHRDRHFELLDKLF